jgi:hypothetical protein
VFAGIGVLIGVAPRIGRELFKIRAVPVPGFARLLEQVGEGFGVVAVVHLEGVESGLGGRDVGAGGGLAGLFPIIFGTTSAARMPMIVMTRSISTRVKARRAARRSAVRRREGWRSMVFMNPVFYLM